ncbi:MAG: carboxypeptidase-like regulatory domain-containing protein [Gammaproteobacteria bacterium]|nr:carboxypeptidase-like regulatory domain-containing protein [Gammaproteobacteria bacterium]
MHESISGQVTINEKETSAGIVVKAVHEPTGSTFAKKTDSSGHYCFDRLKVGGPYVLSVESSGYEGVELGGVNLKTGEAYVQDMNLVRVSA